MIYVLCYQLPITNYQLPITNYQLATTNYQSPISKTILSVIDVGLRRKNTFRKAQIIRAPLTQPTPNS
ncbi:MAG: hypothetical protein WBF90_29070 [Rivularia sp. (in: cyanobacteria)]